MGCLESEAGQESTDVSYGKDPKFKHHLYNEYKFNLESSWSPHLVKSIDAKLNGLTFNRLVNVYLDEAHEAWISQIETFSYVIVSTGTWLFGSVL